MYVRSTKSPPTLELLQELATKGPLADSVLERMIKYTNIEGPHIRWTGAINGRGSPIMSIRQCGISVYRIVYALNGVVVPSNVLIRNGCFRSSCIRYTHLSCKADSGHKKHKLLMYLDGVLT